MSNQLVKTVNVTYTPGSPYVPATPGVPAKPGYWIISYQTQTIAVPATPGVGALPGTDLGLGQTATGATLGGSYTYATVVVPVQVYVQPTAAIPPTPAIAGTSPQTLYNYNLGWNASATSVGSVTNDGYVQFSAPINDVGAIVGIMPAGGTPSFAAVTHAVKFAHQSVNIIESGVPKATMPLVGASDVWQVQRRGGVVRYILNGTVMYTSAAALVGPFMMVGMLYSGGDVVNNPVIAPLNSGAVSMKPLAVGGSIGYGTALHGSGAVSFAPMTVSAGVKTRSAVSFAPMTVLGYDRNFGDSRVSMAPMTASGTGGFPAPAYAVSAVSMSQLTTVGTGKTGTLLHGNTTMAPMTVLGRRAGYGDARVSFQPMIGGGSAYEGNHAATVFSFSALKTTATSTSINYAIYVDGLTMSASMAVVSVNNAVGISALSLITTLLQTLQQGALMNSSLAFTGLLPIYDGSATVWVVNAETGAASHYENFDFTSMTTFQGRYLGVKSDGVYWLDQGPDDNGTPTRASMSFGKQDFKTSLKKRLENAYIGCSSTGTMFLKVIADGIEYIYQSRADGDGNMRATRFDIGKGIRANYLEFELYNGSGADFDLERVEFIALPTERRI